MEHFRLTSLKFRHPTVSARSYSFVNGAENGRSQFFFVNPLGKPGAEYRLRVDWDPTRLSVDVLLRSENLVSPQACKKRESLVTKHRFALLTCL